MVVKLAREWFNTCHVARGLQMADGSVQALYPNGDWVRYEGADAQTFTRAMDEVSYQWPQPDAPPRSGDDPDEGRDVTDQIVVKEQNGERSAV